MKLILRCLILVAIDIAVAILISAYLYAVSILYAPPRLRAMWCYIKAVFTSW